MAPERVQFIKRMILLNAFVPLALVGWDAAHGNLGANPVEFTLRATGTMALLFLAMSLTVTPARRLLGLPWLNKTRRMLGLISFAYACLHVTMYLTLDQSLNLVAIASDAVTRPFIMFGMLAFGLLVPLAWTSTDRAIRRLGKRWGQIHKRVYIVAVAACVHFWLEVKADTTKPLVFAVIFGALLFYRFVVRDLPRGSRAT
jgi:methionine sulfoxide reductase heme-binding subunit